MMEVTLTCSECGSAVAVSPSVDANKAKCDICGKEHDVAFTEKHVQGHLETCPCCERKDFYSQKDFNRNLGVTLFVIAALVSVWMFFTSWAPVSFLPFIVLYIFDFILFRILDPVAICYKCQTIFRKANNIGDIRPYDHEMNDRIVYADHQFDGKAIDEKDSIID